MAHINYSSGTVVTSSWLNDLDTVAYIYFGDGSSLNSPTKLVVTQGVFSTSITSPQHNSGSTGTPINFSLGATSVFDWNTSGNGVPALDNTQSFGLANKRWANIFTPIVDTGTTGSGTLKTNNGTVVLTWVNDLSVKVEGLLNLTAATAGQIAFPATQNPSAGANTLDDYEEGTAIMAFSALTSGTITINASQKTLAYVKIGRQVTITGTLNASSVSSPTGRLRITGLPFTALAGTQFDATAIPMTSGLTSNVALVGMVPNAQNFIDLWRLTTPTTDDAASLVQSGSNFIFSFSYMTT